MYFWAISTGKWLDIKAEATKRFLMNMNDVQTKVGNILESWSHGQLWYRAVSVPNYKCHLDICKASINAKRLIKILQKHLLFCLLQGIIFSKDVRLCKTVLVLPAYITISIESTSLQSSPFVCKELVENFYSKNASEAAWCYLKHYNVWYPLCQNLCLDYSKKTFTVWSTVQKQIIECFASLNGTNGYILINTILYS